MSERFLVSATARRAYVFTKLAVLAAALLLTWPLSHWLGSKAWWAFAIFAAALAVITIIVLAATRDPEPSGDDEDAPANEPHAADSEEPVTLPIEDAIDLHPFSPREIPDVVRDYLEAAYAAGFREVRLIHGRGIGVQRERVRSVLAAHPLVRSFHDAAPSGGGWGATIAYLGDGS